MTYERSHHLRSALFSLLMRLIDRAALLSSWPLKQSCGSSLRCVFKSLANIDSMDCLSFALKRPLSLYVVQCGCLASGRRFLPLPELADTPWCHKSGGSLSTDGFRHTIFWGEPPDQRAACCRYCIPGDKMAPLAGGLESLNSSYCNWKITGWD